jgi:hypothetical protein
MAAGDDLNQHLATYPKGNGLEIKWMTQQPSPVDMAAHEIAGMSIPHNRILDLQFRRTALGMSFEPLFLTVIGERVFRHEDSMATLYIVLDEAIDTDNMPQVLDKAVEFKDKYHADYIFCPKEPDSMVQALRRCDGLGHYPPPQIEAAARTRFKSFVSFERTAAVTARALPTDDAMSSQLNAILDSPTMSPRTNTPMLGADAQPLPRVMFFDDFPTFRTMQGVRTANTGGVTALWLVVTGLEYSTVYEPTQEDKDAERRRFEHPNRNPTGY